MNNARFLLLSTLVLIILCTGSSGYAQEMQEVKIKYGMHKNKVELTLGEPIKIEKMKSLFFLNKEKALYRMEKRSYVLIRYIAGRVNKVTVLDGVKKKEAISFFKEEFN